MKILFGVLLYIALLWVAIRLVKRAQRISLPLDD